MSLQQESIVNQDMNNVDLTKIAGLQQKRTLAFVNHFLVTTVQFLNKFAKDCEEKLMHFERKLEKVNASMVLLESKLSSIPEVNIPTPTETQNPELPKKSVTGNQHSEPEIPTQSDDANPVIEGNDITEATPKPETQEETTVSPKYMRFVKMVQVGVPLQAVKLKLMLEGLDSDVFDKIMNK